MEVIKIQGGQPLSGTINISGAKNAVVALIPAAILSNYTVEINNVPNISDVKSLCEILEFLNIKHTSNADKMLIDTNS